MTVLLPPGYSRKYQLHVIRDIHSDAGSTIGHGGAKGVTHITVTDERHVHDAAQALVGEGFEPNVLFGYDLHTRRPYLYQFAGLDHASKALEHPGGTMETNRGGIIVCQMEIACQVADVPDFERHGIYKALANAWRFINDTLRENHRPVIPWHTWWTGRQPGRLTPSGYITASGHGGHRNVPSQPSGHDDPTAAFRWDTFLHRLHTIPEKTGAWDLAGTGFKV